MRKEGTGVPWGRPLKESPGMRAGTENEENLWTNSGMAQKHKGVTSQFTVDSSRQVDNRKSVFLWRNMGGSGNQGSGLEEICS